MWNIIALLSYTIALVLAIMAKEWLMVVFMAVGALFNFLLLREKIRKDDDK